MIPTITNECSQFLNQSHGLPLLKNLSVGNVGIRKVKLRKKKKGNDITHAFNETFSDHSELMQRAMFAHGMNSFSPSYENGLEPFYVFPIDGYKFMYAENVDNTTESYKDTLNKLVETYGDNGIKTFKEILKYQYNNDNLYDGMSSNAEIILYGIPYYYAIRCSLIENYADFLSN